MRELTPVEIDPKSASREWWRKYHSYRRLRQQEVRPDDPVTPDEVLEDQMMKDDPFMHRRLYCIDGGESLRSTFSATAYRQGSPGYDSNRPTPRRSRSWITARKTSPPKSPRNNASGLRW